MKIENWLSPMNRVIWVKAFRSRSNSVTLRDGRKFRVRYTTKKIFGEDKKVALVIPAYEAFAPMGYFDLEKVTDKLWIEESDGVDSSREGIYVKYLDEFIESGFDGVQPTKEWPELATKAEGTLRAGFNKAKADRGTRAANIRIMANEGEVFLIRDKEGNGS